MKRGSGCGGAVEAKARERATTTTRGRKWGGGEKGEWRV